MMLNNLKPPPRLTPVSVHGRMAPPEPCSPDEEGHLSKSLGDAFLLTGGMLSLHRCVIEITWKLYRVTLKVTTGFCLELSLRGTTEIVGVSSTNI